MREAASSVRGAVKPVVQHLVGLLSVLAGLPLLHYAEGVFPCEFCRTAKSPRTDTPLCSSCSVLRRPQNSIFPAAFAVRKNLERAALPRYRSSAFFTAQPIHLYVCRRVLSKTAARALPCSRQGARRQVLSWKAVRYGTAYSCR